MPPIHLVSINMLMELRLTIKFPSTAFTICDNRRILRLVLIFSLFSETKEIALLVLVKHSKKSMFSTIAQPVFGFLRGILSHADFMLTGMSSVDIAGLGGLGFSASRGLNTIAHTIPCRIIPEMIQ